MSTSSVAAMAEASSADADGEDMSGMDVLHHEPSRGEEKGGRGDDLFSLISFRFVVICGRGKCAVWIQW